MDEMCNEVKPSVKKKQIKADCARQCVLENSFILALERRVLRPKLSLSHSPREMRCGTEDLSRLLLLQHKLQGTYYERPSQHMLSVTCVERLSQS